MENTVRTRFAPSPTGYLHIGGLRTALYAYLFAKQKGGKFILRIEDTDRERYVEGAVDKILNSLKAAGLYYDEGPDIGGDYGPYIQSERQGTYLKFAEKLIERGGAYYCFCSKERIEKIHAEGATKYDKHCIAIPLSEAKKRVAAGEPYVIRQNIPTEGITEYNDLIFGDIKIENKELEDGVLIKSDGMPTYNFANVVDDYLMGINYVIRGIEYLSSTPKYNHLYDGFGWKRPNYIHLQPIMKDATHKLSKRYGDASYEDFIAKGYLSDAIINYILLLGWSPKDNKEKLSFDEMKELFSLDGISKSSSIFDEIKMKWLNSQYIKEMSLDAFHAYALPFYKKVPHLADYDLEYVSELIHQRIEIFSDIGEITKFLTEFEDYDLNLLINEKWKTNLETAKTMLPALIRLTKAGLDNLSEKLDAYANENGYKKGQVLWIFRIAITGAKNTPGGASEMARLLGSDKVTERLQKTLKRLS